MNSDSPSAGLPPATHPRSDLHTAPYTGQVQPGGLASARNLARLRISKMSVGPMDNNAYLLECLSTGQQLLIDAAAQPQQLLSLLDPARLVAIVTTHQHRDHWAQGLAHVHHNCPHARTYAGRDDASGIAVPTDVLLEHADQVRVGAVSVHVISLRGHTPGSIAVLYEDSPPQPVVQPDHWTHHLWTGDSLFPGGPGKTTSPADFTTLMDDLQQRVFDVLPDTTWVYPGHGDDTTLAVERPHLPQWRTRGW